jgi:MurNAc alpha-1-phosphate uridylyltransferase
MILAAGRGERMGELTASQPKPLLKVHGRYLIEYAIQALTKASIDQVVINVSYHAEQIKQALGDGSRYGVQIHYSEESERLETGGGIYQALPLLGSEPFIVVSADVITDYSLSSLSLHPKSLAHLVLVENPTYHPKGDFGLIDNRISYDSLTKGTFGNIGIYRPELFAECKPGRFRLGDLLKKAIHEEKLTGEYYRGLWHNIGTAEDLCEINGVKLDALSAAF